MQYKIHTLLVIPTACFQHSMRLKKNVTNYLKARYPFLLTGNKRKVLKLHIWIPIKSDCIGVTFVPPTYPFDQNTNPDFQKQSGYHLRKGPSLEDSVHSEITYLRKITPRVTMTKSTYSASERNVSKYNCDLQDVTNKNKISFEHVTKHW